jgi:hypothetical protein
MEIAPPKRASPIVFFRPMRSESLPPSTIAPTPPTAMEAKTIAVSHAEYPRSFRYKVRKGTTKVPKRWIKSPANRIHTTRGSARSCSSNVSSAIALSSNLGFMGKKKPHKRNRMQGQVSWVFFSNAYFIMYPCAGSQSCNPSSKMLDGSRS